MKKLLLGALVICFLSIAGVQCGSRNGSGPSSSDAGAADSSLDATAEADLTPPTFGGVTTATDVDDTHVALTWSPATDVVTPSGQIVYRVYVGTAAGQEMFTAPIATTPAGATGAIVGGLHPGTKYFFVVHAVNAAGVEDQNMVEASATTTDTTPPVFAGVESVTGTSGTALLVTWNAATDPATSASGITYDVYVTTTQGGENFSQPTTSVVGATQTTVTGLTNSTTYYVVVRAVDAAGNSDQNRRELSGATFDTTPPEFAGVTSATVSGTVINLAWSPATDNVTPAAFIVYDVYMATAAGGEDFTTPSFTTIAGATKFTVTKLSVSTTYYFVVRARDASGNEDTNTVEAHGTTAKSPDVTPPVFAGLVQATGDSDQTVALTWNAATDDYTPQQDIVYLVYVANTLGGENFGSPSYTTDPGATSFEITGLSPNQTIYAVVRSIDQAGNEDTNKVEKPATTLSDKVPPTFGGLTSAVAQSPTAVLLSWQSATDDVSQPSAITYRVYQGSTPGGEGPTPVLTTAGGATSVQINSLAPKTTYYFYVRAVDGAGNPDTSTPPVEVEVTTPPDTSPPTAQNGNPFGGVQSLVSTSPTTLTATWQPAMDNVTPTANIVYLAYIATASGQEGLGTVPPPAPGQVTASGATSFTFTGLQPGLTYYVVVRAEDAAGNVDTNTNELKAKTQSDTTPPVFAGATNVTGATLSSLTVNWAAATDPLNVTQASQMRYLVCMTKTPGGCSGMSFMATTTVTGNLSTTFNGLTDNTTYYFVVRAEDEFGNTDGNNAQVSGSTSKDSSPPQFPPTGTGLVATALGDASIGLSWSAATDNVTPQSQIIYLIYQGSSSGTETLAYTVTGVTSYTIPQQYPPLLQPSTTYFFYVRAQDAAGNEDGNTDEANAETKPDKTLPTFGGVTSLTNVQATQITANWTAATDDITAPANIVYEVCWATDNSCTTAFSAKGTTTGATSFTMTTNVYAVNTYNVVVHAKDQAGNLDTNTAVLSTTTPRSASPPTFSGPPSISNTTTTTITLTWPLANDPASPQSSLQYLVCMTQSSTGCGGAGGPFSPTATLTNQSSYQFTGLTPSSSYYFVVRAEDPSGNTDSNYNIVGGSTVVDSAPPSFTGSCAVAPEAGAAGASNVVLTWSAGTDPNFASSTLYYDVYQATSSGGEVYTTASYSTPTPGLLTITVPQTTPGLLAQTKYYFVVRTRDPAGLRSANTTSTECSTTTSVDTTPPTFAGITGLTTVSDTQLQATWSAGVDNSTPAAQLRYLVCWNLHGAASPCKTSFVAKATTSAGATSFTNTAGDLVPSMSYDFLVRAEDTATPPNVDTNTVTLTQSTSADTTPPIFGGAVSATNITVDSFQVNWNAATSTDPPIVYDVCVSSTNGGCVTSFSTGAPGASGVSGTSYTVTGLTPSNPGKEYFVIVRARDHSNLEDGNDSQVTPTLASDTNPPSFSGLTSATTASYSSINLAWGQATNNPTEGITFSIYRNVNTAPVNFTSPVATQSQESPNTFTDSAGLTPNTTYCYIVRATNASGDTETNIVSHCATTSPPIISVSGPVVTPSYTSFQLSWGATITPSTTPTYQVCYSTSPTACPSGGTTVTPSPATATSITISPSPPLTPSQTSVAYYFTVIASAFNSTGTNNPAVESGTTADTTPPQPSPPGSFTATMTTSFPNALTLNWNGSGETDNASTPDNIGYQFCAATSGSCTTPTYPIPAGGGVVESSSFFGKEGGTTHGSSLSSNTSYRVGIRAIDQAGNATAWAYATATTAVSYANDVDQIFNAGDTQSISGRANCNQSTCHGTGGGLPGPWGYTYWFVSPANNTSIYCPAGQTYISPGNPAGSIVMQMISGGNSSCPFQMPYGGETVDDAPENSCSNLSPLTCTNAGTTFTADIDTIYSWISQGANNN